MNQTKVSPMKFSGLLLVVMVVFGSCAEATAQTGRALMGQPYGVAEVTVELGANAAVYARSEAFSLKDDRGRTQAPVFSRGRLREAVGGALGREVNEGAPITVMFLFRGDEPLELTIDVGEVQRVVLVPEVGNRRAYRRTLQRWWREYYAASRESEDNGDNAIIYQYTSGLLANQLSLAPPLLSRLNAPSNDDTALQTLQLLAGAEHYRGQLRTDTLLNRGDRTEAADLPLPPPLQWAEPIWSGQDEGVAIEPLASRVPNDCFYIRFGSFTNYLWFTALLDDYGGELANMVTPRAIDRSISETVQGRLGIKQSALAEVVGPTIIADVALIGHDLYTVDGPAMGILFHARNSVVLRNDLTTQRRVAAERMKEEGGREEIIEIAGRQVSLVSTPDNRLRSFYAADGDFHLVTTSRALVERFLRIAEAKDSLGDSVEFSDARRRFPLDREDTIFAYFSTRFFQRLVSPHYQIELRRRLRAATDMELLLLASLAARGQGLDLNSTEQLIDAGFLPPSFAMRPEEGRVELGEDRIVDTLRGARGALLPIPDMEITSATATEVATYQQRSEYYAANWKQFDPLMVGIRRFALNDQGLERLSIEAHIAPLDESKYGWLLSILGPANEERITPVPGDVISVQAFVQGGLLDRNVPPHHLFLGIQDSPADLRATGFLGMLQVIQSTPGYLGGWPKPGFLDWLPPFLGGGEPDFDGYSRLPLGIWRRQFADFSVLSLDRGLLEHVTSSIDIEPAPPAQLRVYVGDLSQSQLQGFIHDLAAERALRASHGNVRLAHTLAEQLRIPRAIAVHEAERLVNGELVCPLDGEYKLVRTDQGSEHWVSTAWFDGDSEREPYQAPLLTWFRGLNADLTRTADGVIVRGELDMQRAKDETPAVQLPLFNLFKGTRPSAAPNDEKKERKGPRRF